MTQTKFSDRVYQLLTQVPAGKITTYKALGQALNTRAYRAIGQVLKVNPNSPHVPCHRVVKTDGEIGGFMGHTTGKEVERKVKLLEQEGVYVKDGQVVDFDQVQHHFA